MDLLKAIDCIPNDLILAKLKAYCFINAVTSRIASSVTTENSMCCSDFIEVYKVVPQGSILGPVIFIIFINGVFHFVTDCEPYTYVDDNTLSISSNDINSLKNRFESNSPTFVKWFKDNRMQANPDQCQAICIWEKYKRRKYRWN